MSPTSPALAGGFFITKHHLFAIWSCKTISKTLVFFSAADVLEEMETVIAGCPRLKVVIGHFGMVTRPGWMEQIRLARHPNVYVESGGITWLFNDEFYPFPSAVRAIREAADEVGIDKLMWGSDYPRTITAITYRMSYDFIVKSNLLSAEEKEKFLCTNARNLFGFRDLIDLPYIRNMSE